MAFALTPALTPLRQKIYKYIVKFKLGHNGNSPSIRDIGTAFGMHTSVVRYHLGRLESIGLIECGAKGESRMINVVGGAWIAPTMPVVLEDADARELLEVVKG